jgi:hypothetical protein
MPYTLFFLENAKNFIKTKYKKYLRRQYKGQGLRHKQKRTPRIIKIKTHHQGAPKTECKNKQPATPNLTPALTGKIRGTAPKPTRKLQAYTLN